MVCVSHRLRKIAALAGNERVRQIDHILRTEPTVARALLEGTCPIRTAEALMIVCARIEMESEAHALRLAEGMKMLARACGFGEAELHELELGALVHDIGKLSVPDAILKSDETLDPSDLDWIRMHCSLGHAVVFGVPGLQRAAELVLHHHEYWDGSGYADGLAGDAIPPPARLFALVDSYEAMVREHRSFRVAIKHELARREIIALGGKRYDPQLVEIFAHLDSGEWRSIWERFPEEHAREQPEPRLPLLPLRTLGGTALS